MELQTNNALIPYSSITKKLQHYIQTCRFSLSSCCLCHNKPHVHPMLCKYCFNDLTLFTDEKIKQNLLSWPAIDKLFPRRKFDRLICLAPYVWPFDFWLKKFKYQKQLQYVDLFAFLLAKLCDSAVSEKEGYCLMSVPLHIEKWQKRGFNQAHLLASALAKKSNLAYLSDAIIRTKPAISQVGKDGKNRRKSLNNAFEITLTSIPKRIILFDDVVTTGSTVNAICDLLKKHGAKEVIVLSLAISLPHSS